MNFVQSWLMQRPLPATMPQPQCKWIVNSFDGRFFLTWNGFLGKGFSFSWIFLSHQEIIFYLRFAFIFQGFCTHSSLPCQEPLVNKLLQHSWSIYIDYFSSSELKYLLLLSNISVKYWRKINLPELEYILSTWLLAVREPASMCPQRNQGVMWMI